ncbi:hypothetical protein FHR81_001782 [Actinoalloteichus hoggarensis]|uniref:hypothetical protein n=1 Tax=Actinoalloteichus hoggarensis TaxID=1470176 RepID=UPI000B8B277A|nr:hypothetical protein [Actinoalloteichus hoggarensis]MBB5920744.1 hypothetical protein [Actinoalloteichus hoggarensis]
MSAPRARPGDRPDRAAREPSVSIGDRTTTLAVRRGVAKAADADTTNDGSTPPRQRSGAA